MNKTLVVTGILVLGLIALPALLPTILSTRPVKNWVLSQAGKRIPGRLDIQSWSLGWLGDMECREVKYLDPGQGIAVQAESITTSKGLLALIFDREHLGAVHVNRPTVDINLPVGEKPGHAGPHQQKGIESSEPGRKPIHKEGTAPEETQGTMPMLPVLYGQLQVRQGAIRTIGPGKHETLIIKDLDLVLDVSGEDNPISYSISFNAGQGTGKVDGKGTIVLQADDPLNLNAAESQARLNIENWDIKDLMAILAANGRISSGSGKVNGHFNVSGSMKSGLKLVGQIKGSDIRMSGGYLKTDTPHIKKLTLDLDALKTMKAVLLNRVTLKSSLASATVSGVIEPKGVSKVETTAQVDMAEVFAQFPKTLNLKKGIRISKGRIDLKAKLQSDGRTTNFDTRVHIDALEGTHGGKKLAWDAPITAETNGTFRPEGLSLGKFQVESAFLNGSGRGDLSDMHIDLNADIQAALKELKKFVDLKGWTAAGKIKLNLHAGARPTDGHFLSADLKIGNFILRQKKNILIPKDNLIAKFNTDFQLDQDSRPSALHQMSLALHSWLGQSDIQLEQLSLDPDRGIQQAKGVVLDADLRLAYLATFLKMMNLMPDEIGLSGQAAIKAKGNFDGSQLNFTRVNLDAKRFVYKDKTHTIRDDRIRLDTKGTVDLNKRAAAFDPLRLETAGGSLRFTTFALSDWRDAAHTLSAKLSGDIDLGRTFKTIKGVLPPQWQTSGRVVFDLYYSGVKQKLKLSGSAQSLRIDRLKENLLSEERIKIEADVGGSFEKQKFVINRLDLSSTPISLKATGRIAPAGRGYQVDAQGSLALDLKLLTPHLKTLFDMNIEMAGKSKRSFAIKIMSTDGTWDQVLKTTDLTATMHAEKIRAVGLTVQSLDVPVTIKDAIFSARIRGAVNQGKLLLRPTLDFNVQPPLFSIPNDSMVLTGAVITESMANELLAKIHPVFRGATAMEGTVDLKLSHFAWPLSKTAQKDAAFAGVLKLNNVKLKTVGLVDVVMTLMKAKEKEVYIDNKTVKFVGRNGRIECSPLRMKVKDTWLVLSGSMGFDQSLDYIAQIPVTRKLVGKAVYPYLKDTTLNIPIRGTVSKPVINVKSFAEAVKNLIQQAGTKFIEEKGADLLKKLFK